MRKEMINEQNMSDGKRSRLSYSPDPFHTPPDHFRAMKCCSIEINEDEKASGAHILAFE